MPATDETHSLRGPIDRGALLDFRAEIEGLEPLATAELDEFTNPRELRVHLDDGVGDAESARLDIGWTVQRDYNVHYTDSLSRNLRWDLHPHEYPRPSGEPHFHPPPAATNDPTDVAPSCIEVREVKLVARAVVDRWRAAYETGTFDDVNNADDPP